MFSSSQLNDFRSAKCLSISVACDFNLSNFRLFFCSKLEMRALHFLFSVIFCCSDFSTLLQELPCMQAFDCLTVATINVANFYSCILNDIKYNLSMQQQFLPTLSTNKSLFGKITFNCSTVMCQHQKTP